VLNSQAHLVRFAALLFFLYAGLTGVVFSILLDVYTTDSVVGAFAARPGCSAAWRRSATRRAQTSAASEACCFGALIGLIAASVAFIFTGGSTFNLIIGYAGVLIFSGLTAYDIQRLKAMQAQGFANADSAEKMAIFGALRLYLDFINLFISLLRIFGGGRR